MGTEIELRLTKTEFERLFRYALIGNFIETFDQEELKEREYQPINMLIQVARMKGFKDLVEEIEGETEVTEKLTNKIEKILNKYDQFAFTKLSMELITVEEEKKKGKAKKVSLKK